MKIFPKFYARRLYFCSSLEEIIEVLIPWIKEILWPESPFLRQVATYSLSKYGGSYAPRFFKKIIGEEIFRLNEFEDLQSIVLLAAVEAYNSFLPEKGNMNLVSWLSWRIPYEASKLVTIIVTHPIAPVDTNSLSQLDEFEKNFENKRQLDIIAKEIGLSKQNKYYYFEKLRED